MLIANYFIRAYDLKCRTRLYGISPWRNRSLLLSKNKNVWQSLDNKITTVSLDFTIAHNARKQQI